MMDFVYFYKRIFIADIRIQQHFIELFFHQHIDYLKLTKMPCSTRLKETSFFSSHFPDVFHQTVYLRIFLDVLKKTLVRLMKTSRCLLKRQVSPPTHCWIAHKLPYLCLFLSCTVAYTTSATILLSAKPHRAYV